eukprot:scaffold658063_cov43-Prasinocladus_malaysianus.AAC.1
MVVGVKRLLEPYRYQILHTLSRAIMPAEDKEKLDSAADDSEASEAADAQALSAQLALQLSAAVQAMGANSAQLSQAVAALTAKMESMAAPGAASTSQPDFQEAFRELQGSIKGLSAAVEG